MTKRLMIRADDLGLSEAVNYGIAKTVQAGCVKTVSVMASAPSAQMGLKLLRPFDVALGVHANISVGTPAHGAAQIPELVNERGEFYESSHYRGAGTVIDTEQVAQEIEAQVERFCALAGREPDYLDIHSVTSPDFIEAARMVAEHHNLPFCGAPTREAFRWGKVRIDSFQTHSTDPDYDPWATLTQAVGMMGEDTTNLYVCHPGYLDGYVLDHSSLTVNRVREVDLLCDERLQPWLAERGVELVGFRDLA